MVKRLRAALFISMLLANSLGLLSLVVLVQNEASWPRAPPEIAKTKHANNHNTSAATLMPRPNLGNILDVDGIGQVLDTTIYRIEASDATGCEPKFNVIRGNKTLIFKPAQRDRLLNEYIAYQVSQMFGFNRVPPVVPVEIPFQCLQDAINRLSSSTTGNLLHCNPDWASNNWITRQRLQPPSSGSSSPDNNTLVLGTLQPLVRGVTQRAELDRSVNKMVYSILEVTPSIFAQREYDTRWMFDVLLGNFDRWNNDFLWSPPRPSISSLPGEHEQDPYSLLFYLDHNGLSRWAQIQPPRYCRFYKSVVDKMYELKDPERVVHDEMLRQHPFTALYLPRKTKVDGLMMNFVLFYLSERRLAVLQLVESCVKAFGHDHAFVEA